MGKTKLLAKIYEYEHALDHIAYDAVEHNYTVENCANLAKSAIEQVNIEDFHDAAKHSRWYYSPYYWYWDIRNWVQDRLNK